MKIKCSKDHRILSLTFQMFEVNFRREIFWYNYIFLDSWKKIYPRRNSFEHPWWVKKNLLKSGIQFSKRKIKTGKPSIKHSTKKLGYTTKDLFIAFFWIWMFLPRLNISKSLQPKILQSNFCFKLSTSSSTILSPVLGE